MSSNLNLNLKNKARNPGSIANDEHNDSSGAQRSANGDIIAIDRILSSAEATAAAGTPVPQRGTLRIANTAAAWAFVYIGDEGTAPATPDITNAIAIAPNSSTMIYTGIPSSEMKALVVKASAGTVQVVIMQQ